ncbi:hypothetical protein HanXRQr2_Chr09g0374801 [Helianthus annuus]|uniref:Uncharacterized protein n=1 Tax=Helianthus annuus TaxID=4232 RepID=A0A9K3I4K8_HELAN|nr:hypothetical protein HanXRQr2_Chr09g0374801 [Helianthus annuus]KAJ0892055.1 hypothetical protein HanPSC8_Chr09g0361351 [Helianthus annuus]
MLLTQFCIHKQRLAKENNSSTITNKYIYFSKIQQPSTANSKILCPVVVP